MGSPGLLHHLLVRLLAGDVPDVRPRGAVDGLVGDVADRQEVGSEPAHTELGHVGERLAHAAAEQEASQLFVEAGDVAVLHEGPRVHAPEAHAVALAQRNLTREKRSGVPLVELRDYTDSAQYSEVPCCDLCHVHHCISVKLPIS